MTILGLNVQCDEFGPTNGLGTHGQQLNKPNDTWRSPNTLGPSQNSWAAAMLPFGPPLVTKSPNLRNVVWHSRTSMFGGFFWLVETP